MYPQRSLRIFSWLRLAELALLLGFALLTAGVLTSGTAHAQRASNINSAAHSDQQQTPPGASIDVVTSQPGRSHRPHFFLHPRLRAQTPSAGNNLNYGGGPVMAGTAHVYAIFWEPTSNVSANYNSLLKRYFGDIGGNPLYAINTQYTQTGGAFPSNTMLAGSWVDRGAYPESPLLDSDMQNEVTHAQQVNGWTTNIDNVFFVFLERNTNLCFDSTQSQCASNTFCAYHSFFGTNTIYAAMPYAASFPCDPGSSPNHDDADQTINISSHEQMEAATDPLINAWTDSSGQEIGDKCNFTFGPRNSQGADVVWNSNPYIVQGEWDNNTSGCALTPSTTPAITLNLPSPITTNATSAQGAVVSYTVTASDPVYPATQLTLTCSPASGSTFAIGSTTVHCTVSDPAGNSASGSFQVVVKDTTPPSLSLPTSPLTVDATSPQGAIVPYTVTATDPDNTPNQLTISCTPASGSTFAIGSTTVHCTATDPAGNSASGSFTVVVNSAATQISNLITTVNNFHFSKNIQTSLDVELQVALYGVTHNKPKVACAALDVFRLEVTKLTGNGITSSQASQLLASAKQIQAVIGC